MTQKNVTRQRQQGAVTHHKESKTIWNGTTVPQKKYIKKITYKELS